MLQDEILDEIRKIREEHAKSFDYDLDAMFVDWQKKQSESGREVVNFSVRGIKTRWSGQAGDISRDIEDTSHPST